MTSVLSHPLADWEYPRVPFKKHVRELPWSQGEHVLICAPTNAGKTTFSAPIIAKRSHVVNFVTKSYDETFAREFKGWERIEKWGPSLGARRVLLWPRKKKGMTVREFVAYQRQVFREALDAIDNEKGWCVVIDESHYMTDPNFLGLASEIAILHHQGRSSGISVVSLTQRPAWIPKIIYSSVSHAYIARTRDVADLKRLADLGGIDAKELAANVVSLTNRHDFVYVSPQTDALPAVLNSRK